MKYSWMCGVMLTFCVVIAGCDTLERSTERAGNGIYTNYTKTRQKIAGYIYKSEAAEQQQSYRPYEEPIFCYRLMMDTSCYNKPQPHLHEKLVAVQGIHDYHYHDFVPEFVIQSAPNPSAIHISELDNALPPQEERPIRLMK